MMASDEKITIFFEPKGDKELVKAINSLARSQGRLSTATDKTNRSNQRNSKSSKGASKGMLGLGGTLSVVRSKLLVYGFAMKLANDSIGKMVSLAMQQEDAEKRLAIQYGKNTKGLLEQATALQKVTAFGDEAVMGVQAQMAAFTKDEETIKQLTEATLDLAEGRGIDLATAGDLVSKSYGSSTNALSRYGIAVNGAADSSTRLKSLTGNIDKLYGGMSTNIDTTSKALKQMGNAFGDLGEEVGSVFLPITKTISMGLTRIVHEGIIPFIQNLKTIDFGETFINLISNFKLVYEFIIKTTTTAFKLVVTSIKMLAQTFISNLPDIAVKAFDFLQAQIKQYMDFIAPFVTNVLKLTGLKIAQFFSRLFNEPVNTVKKALNIVIRSINSYIDSVRPALERFGFEIGNIGEIATETFSETKWDKQIKETMKSLEGTEMFKSIKDSWGGSGDDLSDIWSQFGDNFAETIGMLIAKKEELTESTGGDDEDGGFFKSFKLPEDWAEQMQQYVQAVAGVGNAYDKLKMQQINQAKQAELDTVKGIRNERIRTNAIEEIEGRYAAKVKAQKEKMKDIKVAEAISNTALGMTKAQTDPGGIAGWILAGLIGIQGLMNIKTIKGQKYQYGGMVGGRRHSQGGTMIEAEQGEFVMNRDAVDAVGIENLNRMNTGLGGGGGASIVINNPVLGKDTIEDEIVPQIKEALRRGGSIA